MREMTPLNDVGDLIEMSPINMENIVVHAIEVVGSEDLGFTYTAKG